MTAILIRIFIKYGAAALVARGILTHDISDSLASDPDIAMALNIIVGGALGCVAEGCHYAVTLLRRRGQ
jgi:hypothetical protein